jgi:hypothetical protein
MASEEKKREIRKPSVFAFDRSPNRQSTVTTSPTTAVEGTTTKERNSGAE